MIRRRPRGPGDDEDLLVLKLSSAERVAGRRNAIRFGLEQRLTDLGLNSGRPSSNQSEQIPALPIFGRGAARARDGGFNLGGGPVPGTGDLFLRRLENQHGQRTAWDS